jgi:3-phosphoshikimate 1-carboxyvinyltransferase
MAFAVAGARALGPVEILDAANVATSYPDFVTQGRAIGLCLEARDDG